MYIRDMAARWKRTKGWKRDGEKEVEREREREWYSREEDRGA